MTGCARHQIFFQHYLILGMLQTDSIGRTGVRGGQWDSQLGLGHGAEGTEIGDPGVPILLKRAELHRQILDLLCNSQGTVLRVEQQAGQYGF